MNPWLNRLRARIDELSFRERVLLFLTLMTALLVAWQSLLMDPIAAKKERFLDGLAALQREVAALEHQNQDRLAAHAVDPDMANRRAKRELSAKLAQLNRTAHNASGLVEHKQMAQMLEEWLKRHPGLTLTRAESLVSKPLWVDEDGKSGAVFQHGLRVELEGPYRDTLAYLHALQQLPYPVYWDDLQVVMDKHPMVHLTFTVHCLSLSENWFGA